MGNSQQTNQKFNPNFNMDEYNLKLQQASHQYQQNNLHYNLNQIKTQDINCQQIKRNVYIFKPSIEIHINNQQIAIQFQYHCLNQCYWEFHLGVNNIAQNSITKQTQQIKSILKFQQILIKGQKNKFSKKYPLININYNALLYKPIIMKLICNQQISQYSLIYDKKSKLWKVAIQNFTLDNKTYGIQDIYGGDSSTQCIICLVQKATIMVKPCNHICLCASCQQYMISSKSTTCPICRKQISQFVTLTKTNLN